MSRAEIRISILGGTGYGGGELIRLIHGVELPGNRVLKVVHATSRSKAGTPVAALHRHLHRFPDLKFSNPTPEQVLAESHFIFGALPHGTSSETLAPFVDQGARVIDLSGDFRLRSSTDYKRWYRHQHPRPDLLGQAVYGCPELNSDRIRTSHLVASPGCFATSINLALLPVAANALLAGTPTVVAMTGSSGSGTEPSAGTHHPTRAETMRPYKVLEHQHTPEVLQLLTDAGAGIKGLHFIPISAPIVRGILAVATADLVNDLSTDEMLEVYRQFYRNHPFVRVITDREPECATVAGTNYVEVRPRVSADGTLTVVCAIDNLIKGGAGQAVQSLLIMLGAEDEKNLPIHWSGLWP